MVEAQIKPCCALCGSQTRLRIYRHKVRSKIYNEVICEDCLEQANAGEDA